MKLPLAEGDADGATPGDVSFVKLVPLGDAEYDCTHAASALGEADTAYVRAPSRALSFA